MDRSPVTEYYWSHCADEVLDALGSHRHGLSAEAAAGRLRQYGRNTLAAGPGQSKALRLFLDRFRSPLVLILVFAAVVAFIVHDWLDALIVLAIVIITAVLGFIQEYRATRAVDKLRQRVSVKSTVVRGGQKFLIPSEEVVPGDIVQLTAGSLIPADGMLLEARDFFVSQALLTGETFPVEKQPGVAAQSAGLMERRNCVYMGTSVRSGTAAALMVHTGKDTSYGQIADKLALRPPETEFERGLRHFGALLLRIMMVIVLVILVINIALQHPTIETVLFAMALAVGLSPELLPAILTITLARGAKNMAKLGVIVKRLNAIENLGSMDVLCTDKTGTLTKGVVQLDNALDVAGQPCAAVLRHAYLNSSLQTGLANPLDEAVVAAGEQAGVDVPDCHKLDEIPYDFVRKRLSIVVGQQRDASALLITKGALQNVLDVCDRVQDGALSLPLDAARYQAIKQRFADWSGQGYRVLGLAQKAVPAGDMYTRHDEQGLVFTGFLLFFDPPEAGVRKTLDELRRRGVRLKIITGDNHLVARHVAEAVGIKVKRIITGSELAAMKDEALWHLAPRATLFAEVDPNQKERIITALQKTGHVVGYLGDGINDAPALHAAIPAMGIAGDHVDRDWERTPHRWDMKMIRNFMITFGLVSTVFDLLTFAVLLYFAGEAAAVFRTGWFVESLLTELLILFVIRTRKPFHQSRAGRFLVWSTAGIVLLTLMLPYLPIGRVFDFVPLPVPVLVAILLVTGLYVVASEFTKRAFFRRFDKQFR